LTGDFFAAAGFPTLDTYLRFFDFEAAGFVAVGFFGFAGVAAIDTTYAASVRIPR
jgi:preprotein translocase subunit Sss1